MYMYMYVCMYVCMYVYIYYVQQNSEGRTGASLLLRTLVLASSQAVDSISLCCSSLNLMI